MTRNLTFALIVASSFVALSCGGPGATREPTEIDPANLTVTAEQPEEANAADAGQEPTEEALPEPRPISCTPTTAPRMSLGPDECKKREEWLEGEGCAPPSLARDLEKCRAGDLGICSLLGFLFTDGKNPLGQDVCRGILSFAKACSKEEARACAEVGQARLSGRGATKDVSEAILWLNKACTWGYERACGQVEKLCVDLESAPPCE